MQNWLLLWKSSICFILDGVESVTIRPANPLAVKGSNITLFCFADGNPTPAYSDYQWKLSGYDLPAGPTLILSNIQYVRAGLYTCVVKNAINVGEREANATVELRVEGKMLSFGA